MTVVDNTRFDDLPNSTKRNTINMRLSSYVSQLFDLELTKGENEAIEAAGGSGGPGSDPMAEASESNRKNLEAKVDFLKGELAILDALEDQGPPASPTP